MDKPGSHTAMPDLVLLGPKTVVADVSPSKVDLLLRDTVSHGVPSRLASGVKPLVLSKHVQPVNVVQGEEADSGAHDWSISQGVR